MINILVFNKDKAGVGYYRQTNPHIKLQELFPEEFYVEITENVDFNNDEYLKKFQIIQFTGSIVDYVQMPKLVNKLKNLGIKVIMDIDDYWVLPNTHPMYRTANKNIDNVIQNIKLADLITTTTPQLANEIKKYNKNVEILYNAIDPDEEQFQIVDNKKTDRVRVGIITGSSHEKDIELLSNSFGIISSDNTLKKDIQVVICGFDLRGYAQTINYVNEDVKNELTRLGLYTKKTLIDIHKHNGNLSRIGYLPESFKVKYGYKLKGEKVKKQIPPTQNLWYKTYEKVLTNQHKLIDDNEYNKFLHTFKNTEYPNVDEQAYRRYFTLPIKRYATHYNNIDVSLAPLVDNKFNTLKSELKMIEAGFFKKPIIVSDMYPYNNIAENGVNCLSISDNRNKRGWYKAIKRLVNNESYRKELGENLYETVKDKYNLNNVTVTRKDIYKELVK